MTPEANLIIAMWLPLRFHVKYFLGLLRDRGINHGLNNGWFSSVVCERACIRHFVACQCVNNSLLIYHSAFNLDFLDLYSNRPALKGK